MLPRWNLPLYCHEDDARKELTIVASEMPFERHLNCHNAYLFLFSRPRSQPVSPVAHFVNKSGFCVQAKQEFTIKPERSLRTLMQFSIKSNNVPYICWWLLWRRSFRVKMARVSVLKHRWGTRHTKTEKNVSADFEGNLWIAYDWATWYVQGVAKKKLEGKTSKENNRS